RGCSYASSLLSAVALLVAMPEPLYLDWRRCLDPPNPPLQRGGEIRVRKLIAAAGSGENLADQVRIAPAHSLGQYDQIARFRIDAGQGIQFQEIRHSLAQPEIDAGYISTAKHLVALECRL